MDKRTIDEKAIEAHKMETMGHLAAGIAHDFNNLLTVIIGCSDLLHQQLQGDTALQKYASEIQGAAERAVKLTQQLMSLGHKKKVALPKVVDLVEFVQEQNDAIKRLCSKKIEFTQDLGKESCPVRVDVAQLEQLVFNFVSEAASRMPEGGTLKIVTRSIWLKNDGHPATQGLPEGHYVRLSFTDSGAALSKEEKSEVFEKSLALATCYSLVKQLAGYMTVESVGTEGATFSVFLSAMGKELLETTQVPKKANSLGHSILLVEDESKLRELVESVLVASGFKVISAANGKEGVQIVKESNLTHVDLILTDVIMPHMSGKQMVDQLKPILPNAKIVYMSGYTDDALAPHGVLESDITLIEKPFLAKDLVKKINSILGPQPSA